MPRRVPTEVAAAAITEWPSRPGCYVHLPFCRSRCDYCAFVTFTGRDHLQRDYLDAVRRELDAALTGSPSLAPFETVFVGGGTPSFVPAKDLALLIAAIPVVSGAEITVECNPEDVSGPMLQSYLAAGVTRISLGVQSLSATVLRGLGREGDRATALSALELIGRAGLSSYSVDLIFGAAAERDADLVESLTTLLCLDRPPPHVSAYALTVEPGTPLQRDTSRHPDDDTQAQRYELVDELLTGAGLKWYEISNFAQPGHRCRHNLGYWAGGDYLGLGAAAHSHREGVRSWNLPRPERYIATVRAGRSPEAGHERLDPATQVRERLELALRTRAGVPDEALPDTADLDGLVERAAGQVVLTRRGRLLANEVLVRLSPDRLPGWRVNEVPPIL